MWQKLDEKIIHKGYRTLAIRKYKLPNGKEHEYEVNILPEVVSMLALTKVDKNSERQVIIARQFRPGPEKTLGELPAGYIEKGETPLEAGERELMEETGYRGKFRYLGSDYRSAYTTLLVHSFLVEDCELVGEQKFDEGEYIKVEKMDIDKFIDHLWSGELCDGVTAFKGLIAAGVELDKERLSKII